MMENTYTLVKPSSLLCVIIFFLISMAAPSYQQLQFGFYSSSCPNLEDIVFKTVQQAVQNERRMAASLLRLFFHDCFVQGCDASILLDDTPTLRGEKTAAPNVNSVRGFEVIDTIKANVEAACKGVVSCADILALAARDAVVLSDGPGWPVLLGRRDSRDASFAGANTNLPSPSLATVDALAQRFNQQGLSLQDLVTLSGAHTIGLSRCLIFKRRLYNASGDGKPDPTLNAYYVLRLRSACPPSGGDDNLSPLDPYSSSCFDNQYYLNLQNQRGLFSSDQALYSQLGSAAATIVQDYSQNSQYFFGNFVASMTNMGNIKPLTSPSGEIRQNCHVVN